MASFNKVEFIGGISWKHIFTYFSGRTSLLRQYQIQLLAKYGREFTGRVVELGCEKGYRHERFFPRADFVCTNIARDYDEYLDITDMKDVADNSQDGYVCVAVLEHVADFQSAINEIHRTLKIGGQLLVVVPFVFSYHDEVDYWRFSQDAYLQLFKDYEIVSFIHMGSKFSAIADELQRPRGRLTPRYLVYKFIGFWIALFGKFLDSIDGFPAGYGMYAIKRR